MVFFVILMCIICGCIGYHSMCMKRIIKKILLTSQIYLERVKFVFVVTP